MQEEFGFNNPFERNSVGEEEIWAEGEEGFQDVEIINQSAFKILLVGEFHSCAPKSKLRPQGCLKTALEKSFGIVQM